MAHLETDATGKQSGFQLLGILLLLRENTAKLVRPRARFNPSIHGLKFTKARQSGTFLGLVDRGGGSCGKLKACKQNIEIPVEAKLNVMIGPKDDVT